MFQSVQLHPIFINIQPNDAWARILQAEGQPVLWGLSPARQGTQVTVPSPTHASWLRKTRLPRKRIPAAPREKARELFLCVPLRSAVRHQDHDSVNAAHRAAMEQSITFPTEKKKKKPPENENQNKTKARDNRNIAIFHIFFVLCNKSCCL